MPKLIHLNGAVRLIGGWQDTFFQTFEAAQLHTAAVAETHLRTGHDVVMPQLATRVADILTAEKPVALGRFADRVASGTSRRIDDIVQERGGTAMVERIHDQLTAYLPQRPGCAVVRTDGREPAQTYGEVLALLRSGSGSLGPWR